MYADDFNYWKTSRTSPDKWLEKTVDLIEKHGGQVIQDYFGQDRTTGKAAYKITFRIDEDTFDLVWPVLPTKSGNETEAAKRQAATAIYHHVKAALLAAQVIGARVALFGFYMLPDGRTPAQVGDGYLLEALPGAFRQLPAEV